MRARNLKPNFFKNEQLADLPFEARLLFIGLWCMADREGRLEDRPKRIKAEVFPYDTVNVEKLLDVITCHGLTLHYEINEKRYIQVINFKKHQHPHPHEAESILPAMSLQAVKCHLPAGLNPDVRNPDVLNPDVLNSATRLPVEKSFQEQREYRIPEPKDDPLGAVVMYYKAVRKAVPYNDRTWDKQQYSRASKSSKVLLEICGSYEAAKACLDQFATDMDAAGRSWTLETVVKWAHEWKGKNGGKDYGATNSASFFNAVAKQRTDRKFAELRKVSTPGQILDGIRTMQRVRDGPETDNRAPGNADESALETIRENTLETEADRGQES